MKMRAATASTHTASKLTKHRPCNLLKAARVRHNYA